MSLIPFPAIPAYPGVPNIPRSVRSSTAFNFALATPLAGVLIGALQVNQKWGIYDDQGIQIGDTSTQRSFIANAVLSLIETPALTSTVSLSYVSESRVADFPVEGGSFATYNKVIVPSNPVVTLALSGSKEDRTHFLYALEDAKNSTDLYSVVTPEITYLNYNIQSLRYDRTAERGANMLVVELSLVEVRAVSAQFATVSQITQPKDVGATPQVDGGLKQAVPPPPSTLKSLSTTFGSLFGGG